MRRASTAMSVIWRRRHSARQAFERFPTWMWRNQEVLGFLDWLRHHNESLPAERRTAFRGLDVYSLGASIEAVLAYLDKIDPNAASGARRRYGCLTPWQDEPADYGRAVLYGQKDSCEEAAIAQLNELLAHRLDYMRQDGEEFFDAAQNARIVRAAERYYRIMYRGGNESLESARPPYVRHAADAAARRRGGVEGRGLGPQLAYRQRRSDRDGLAWRVQYRRIVPHRLRR